MSKENPWYKIKAVDLTLKAKPNGAVVRYPVSYSYNGGIVIDDEWFAGYEVADPIIPDGYELVDMCMGLELNCHPPMATGWLKKK